MKIFDVGNTSKIGFFCAAPDEETAKQIAFKAGHARKLENLRVHDVTEGFIRTMNSGHTGILEILSGEKTGRVIGRMQSYTMEEVLRGVKKPPTHWVIA